MEEIALMFAPETAIAVLEVGEMRSCCGLLVRAIGFSGVEVVELR